MVQIGVQQVEKQCLRLRERKQKNLGYLGRLSTTRLALNDNHGVLAVGVFKHIEEFKHWERPSRAQDIEEPS